MSHLFSIFFLNWLTFPSVSVAVAHVHFLKMCLIYTMLKHNRKEKLDTSVCSKHDSLSSGFFLFIFFFFNSLFSAKRSVLQWVLTAVGRCVCVWDWIKNKLHCLLQREYTVFIVIKEHISQCTDAAHMFLWKFIVHRIMNIPIHINNLGKKAGLGFVFLQIHLPQTLNIPFM